MDEERLRLGAVEGFVPENTVKEIKNGHSPGPQIPDSGFSSHTVSCRGTVVAGPKPLRCCFTSGKAQDWHRRQIAPSN